MVRLLILVILVAGCSSTRTVRIKQESSLNTETTVDTVATLPVVRTPPTVTAPLEILHSTVPVLQPTLSVITVEIEDGQVKLTRQQERVTFKLPALGERLVIRADTTDSTLIGSIGGRPEDLKVEVPIERKRSALDNIATTAKWSVIGLILILVSIAAMVAYKHQKMSMLLTQGTKGLLQVFAKRDG